MCVCVDIKQVVEYKKLYWKSMKQSHRMFLGRAACEHSGLHSVFSEGRLCNSEQGIQPVWCLDSLETELDSSLSVAFRI